MQYKGTHKTLPEIARELNLDAALEGAVLRSGDQLRITAQLIEAATDHGDQYKRTHGDARLTREGGWRMVSAKMVLQSEIPAQI